ncbi:MAG: EamA family transporter [archaeon]|nr:MAG: EamA family transporter [archaeon]
MNYVVLALIAMVAFGIPAIMYKLASPHIDPVSTVLIAYMCAGAFTAVVWYFTPGKVITLTGVKYVALAAFFGMIGMIMMVSALKQGPVHIVSPIRSMALLVTVVLAIFILGEKLTLVKGIGIVFATIALILLST